MPGVSCGTLFSLPGSSLLPPQALYPPPHPEAALGCGQSAGTPAGQPAPAGAAPQPGLEGRGREGRPHLQPPEGRSCQREGRPKNPAGPKPRVERTGYPGRATGCPAPQCTGRCPFLALTWPRLPTQPVFGTLGPCQMVTLVGKGLCRGRHRCRNCSALCQGGGGERGPSPKQPESNRFYFMSCSLTFKGKKKKKKEKPSACLSITKHLLWASGEVQAERRLSLRFSAWLEPQNSSPTDEGAKAAAPAHCCCHTDLISPGAPAQGAAPSCMPGWAHRGWCWAVPASCCDVLLEITAGPLPALC